MARCLLLSLTTTLTQRVAAASPAWVQSADAHGTAAKAKAPEKAHKPNSRSFISAWAITDNLNNLPNVRLYPGGKAVSTVGTSGVAFCEGYPAQRQQTARTGALAEVERWCANRLQQRLAIWIDGSPAGLIHASW